MDVNWRPVEVDPKAVEVNGNGHRDIIDPIVDLVPGTGHHINGVKNGHTPAPVNGHLEDEATEPQQTLFSWAEEPAKPKRSRGKPQPASMSMFEWAFEQQREREVELAVARR